MQRIAAGIEKLGGQAAPMVLNMKGPNIAESVTRPLGTITTKDSHCLISPWMLTLRQSWQARHIDAPMTTVTAGGNNHALIYQPEVVAPRAEDCGFRMLEPHEIQRGMGFEDEYTVLGGKRDKVKQLGNAVCPPIAQAIAKRVVAALSEGG
jgi:DNA (cytosine-5)-methyltransferase 1